MTAMRDPKTGRFVKAPVQTVEPVVNSKTMESEIMSGIIVNEENLRTEETKVEQVNEEVTHMETEVETPKKNRFDTKNSRADVIRDALITGAATTDDVVNAVIAKRPDDDPKKVKSQIRAILRDVKDGRGRWKIYDVMEQGVGIVLK